MDIVADFSVLSVIGGWLSLMFVVVTILVGASLLEASYANDPVSVRNSPSHPYH